MGVAIYLGRRQKGWKQQELAEQCGWKQGSQISKYETGDEWPETSIPKIADGLDTTEERLLANYRHILRLLPEEGEEERDASTFAEDWAPDGGTLADLWQQRESLRREQAALKLRRERIEERIEIAQMQFVLEQALQTADKDG